MAAFFTTFIQNRDNQGSREDQRLETFWMQVGSFESDQKIVRLELPWTHNILLDVLWHKPPPIPHRLQTDPK